MNEKIRERRGASPQQASDEVREDEYSGCEVSFHSGSAACEELGMHGWRDMDWTSTTEEGEGAGGAQMKEGSSIRDPHQRSASLRPRTQRMSSR